jgi:hypothetical protein
MTSLTGLSPNNPLVYVGASVALATVVTRNREPTGADYRQPETGKLYPFNTFWLVGKNPTTGIQGELWYLSKIASNIAYWLKIPTTSVTLGFAVIMQVFTSSGTYTPSANMVYCQVNAIGAGGGGGGVALTGSSARAAAGGGGGGETAFGLFTAINIGASQAITIGAGGAGGVGNAIGQTGGTTSIGALMSAIGGSGGAGSASTTLSSSAAGGDGGTGGTGGNYRFQGGFGDDSFVSSSDGLIDSGDGGTSSMSGGIRGIRTSVAGTNANGYGGGGSGAGNLANQAARNGGNGSDGIVVITEFIAT